MTISTLMSGCFTTGKRCSGNVSGAKGHEPWFGKYQRRRMVREELSTMESFVLLFCLCFPEKAFLICLGTGCEATVSRGCCGHARFYSFQLARIWHTWVCPNMQCYIIFILVVKQLILVPFHCVFKGSPPPSQCERDCEWNGRTASSFARFWVRRNHFFLDRILWHWQGQLVFIIHLTLEPVIKMDNRHIPDDILLH